MELEREYNVFNITAKWDICSKGALTTKCEPPANLRNWTLWRFDYLLLSLLLLSCKILWCACLWALCNHTLRHSRGAWQAILVMIHERSCNTLEGKPVELYIQVEENHMNLNHNSVLPSAACQIVLLTSCFSHPLTWKWKWQLTCTMH